MSQRIAVCQYRSCERNGSVEVLAALRSAVPAEISVTASDCLGQCASGPTVIVMPDQVWYCRVNVADVGAIVAEHLQAGQPVARLLHPRFHPQFDREPEI
jgi:(2Fe-2S) ferredoxin